jgi:TRAP-type C4-dicarboxylate transport system permease large subunit
VIVSGAGIALGFIALIVPGILLAMRWAVVAQVAAIEHDGWIPSLRRSAELTRTHYGHIFGLLLLVGVVTAGVTAGARAIPLGSTSGVASVALGIAVHTITASLAALTVAILYFDLKARLRSGPPQIVEHQHLHDLDPSPSEEDD